MEEIKEFLMGFEQRINKKMDQKFEQKFQEIKQEAGNSFNTKMDDFKKELLDQLFLFEEEYGTKIEAIYDAVTLELDKNLEKSEKIRKLDQRMDRVERNLFAHEKRISLLENNQ